MLSGKCSVKSAIGSHWVGSGCYESLTCVCCTVHHEQPNLSLNKKAGLDVMQSHLLCRTHFGQYLISCTGIIRRWGLLHKIRLPPAAASRIIAAYELPRVKPYRMVGNFRCFFFCCCFFCLFFSFFFSRIKGTTASELRFNLALNFKLSSRPNCNRSLSANVSFEAIAFTNGLHARYDF